jgi:hypothetical protein
MSQEWFGRTDEVEAPSLAGGWWVVGMKVRGVIVDFRVVKVQGGGQQTNLRLELAEPVLVGEDSCDVVEMPALTGFRMAVDAIRKKDTRFAFHKDQILEIECVGIKPPREPKPGEEPYSPRPNFALHVVGVDAKDAKAVAR